MLLSVLDRPPSVGLEDPELIPDTSITASSTSPESSPIKIRLDQNETNGWKAETENNTEYIQIDIGMVYNIHAVRPEGTPSSNQWVTEYKLQFSLDGSEWRWYTEKGAEKV